MTKSPPPNQAPETSSLFSLSSLQEMASSNPAASQPARPQLPIEEGSGMLDIKAIADASRKAAPQQFQPQPTPLPNLLASAVGQVALAEESNQRRNRLLFGAMGLAILLLGGAVGYLALNRAPEAAAGATVQGEPQAAAAPAPAVPPPSSAPAEAPAAAPEPEPAQAEEPAVAQKDPADKREPRHASDAPKPAEPAAEAPAKSADKSIDNLLDQALGAGGAPKKAREPKPVAAGSATPSRDEVLAAMTAITPRVKDCAKGQGGVAMAKVTFSGSTGRAVDVQVSGVDGAVKSCVAHEAARAKLPAFSNPTFSVTYPFKL